MRKRVAVGIVLLLMLVAVSGCQFLTPPIKNISGPKTEVSKDEHSHKTIYIRIKPPTTQPAKENEDENTGTNNDSNSFRRIGLRFRNGGRGK